MSTRILIAFYLAAIVIANLTVAWFGPIVVIVNAFVLIAFDLTSRDRLHEAWHGDWRKLGALILAGSVLSSILDYAALPIAIVSFCAFLLSEVADTLVYHRLERKQWYVKVNGSNLISAAVDSAIFLSGLALFGLLPWSLVPLLALGQWGAKASGGAIWSWILNQKREEAKAQ